MNTVTMQLSRKPYDWAKPEERSERNISIEISHQSCRKSNVPPRQRRKTKGRYRLRLDRVFILILFAIAMVLLVNLVVSSISSNFDQEIEQNQFIETKLLEEMKIENFEETLLLPTVINEENEIAIEADEVVVLDVLEIQEDEFFVLEGNTYFLGVDYFIVPTTEPTILWLEGQKRIADVDIESLDKIQYLNYASPEKYEALLRTIQGEAGGASIEERIRVATVIDNRSNTSDISHFDVVSANGQFESYELARGSYYNDGVYNDDSYHDIVKSILIDGNIAWEVANVIYFWERDYFYNNMDISKCEIIYESEYHVFYNYL